MDRPGQFPCRAGGFDRPGRAGDDAESSQRQEVAPGQP